jgi:hypothetical protein
MFFMNFMVDYSWWIDRGESGKQKSKIKNRN